MAQGVRTADVCARFSLLIRALVTDRDAVSVSSVGDESNRPVIAVHVAPHDVRRVLGKEGRVARSLRVLLDSIGEKQGVEYLLDIDGILIEPDGWIDREDILNIGGTATLQ